MSGLLNAKNLTLILAGGMSLLAIYARTASPETYNASRMKIFTDMLGAFSVVVFGLTLLGTQSEDQVANRLRSIDYTDKNIREQWIEPNAMFASKAAIAPEMVASLNMQNPTLQTACRSSPAACAKAATEQNLAIEVAQRIENYLTFRDSAESTGDNTWISCFLPWVRSAYFQKYYPVIKYAYRDRTDALVELMIEYSGTKPMNTSEDIDRTANLLIADSRFKKLLTMTT